MQPDGLLHALVESVEGGRFRELQPKYFPAQSSVHIWELDPDGYKALLARADPGDVLLLSVLVREHLIPASEASRPVVLERRRTMPVVLRGKGFVRLPPPTAKLPLVQSLEQSKGANAVVHLSAAAQTQTLLVHSAKHPTTQFVVALRDATVKEAVAVLGAMPAVIFVRLACPITKAFGDGGLDPALQARIVWVGDKVLPLRSLWAPAARTVYGPDADIDAIASAHAEYYAAGLK